MTEPAETCSIQGCDEPLFVGGLCDGHAGGYYMAMLDEPEPDPRLVQVPWYLTDEFLADPSEAIRSLRAGYVPVWAESLLNLGGEPIILLKKGDRDFSHGGTFEDWITVTARTDGTPVARLRDGRTVGLNGDAWVRSIDPAEWRPSLYVYRSAAEVEELERRLTRLVDHDIDVLLVNGGSLRFGTYREGMWFEEGPEGKRLKVSYWGDTDKPLYIDADMIVDIRRSAIRWWEDNVFTHHATQGPLQAILTLRGGFSPVSYWALDEGTFSKGYVSGVTWRMEESTITVTKDAEGEHGIHWNPWIKNPDLDLDRLRVTRTPEQVEMLRLRLKAAEKASIYMVAGPKDSRVEIILVHGGRLRIPRDAMIQIKDSDEGILWCLARWNRDNKKPAEHYINGPFVNLSLDLDMIVDFRPARAKMIGA